MHAFIVKILSLIITKFAFKSNRKINCFPNMAKKNRHIDICTFFLKIENNEMNHYETTNFFSPKQS